MQIEGACNRSETVFNYTNRRRTEHKNNVLPMITTPDEHPHPSLSPSPMPSAYPEGREAQQGTHPTIHLGKLSEDVAKETQGEQRNRGNGSHNNKSF